MNPVVIVHLLAAVVTMVAACPLMRGRVQRNPWYGVRIPAAFASEESWFDLNRYGGRLLLWWGLSIAITAGVGAFLDKKDWLTYNWTSLVIIMGGLAVIVVKILMYAQKEKSVRETGPVR